MSKFLTILVLFWANISFAQDSLLWAPPSSSYPIHSAKIICANGVCQNVSFVGAYRDLSQDENKVVYKKADGTRGEIFYNQFNWIDYNFELWSDDIVRMSFTENGQEKTLYFLTKEIINDLRKHFRGIPAP